MPRTEEQFQKMREKTSRNILNSALRLFAERGFHGTSISDIAKDAEISKGLIYNYYESKNAILEGIFGELLLIGVEIEKDAYEVTDPYEQIERMILTSFKYVEDDPSYWKLIVSLMLQPEVLKKTTSVFKEFTDRVVHEITSTFKKLGVKNAANEARIFGALIDGIFLHYLFDMENYPLKKMKKFFIEKYSKENIEKMKIQ